MGEWDCWVTWLTINFMRHCQLLLQSGYTNLYKAVRSLHVPTGCSVLDILEQTLDLALSTLLRTLLLEASAGVPSCSLPMLTSEATEKQVTGLLPPTWDTSTEFLVPSCGLTQAQPQWAFGEWTNWWQLSLISLLFKIKWMNFTSFLGLGLHSFTLNHWRVMTWDISYKW